MISLKTIVGTSVAVVAVVLVSLTGPTAAQQQPATPIPTGSDLLLSPNVGMGSEVTVLVLLDIDCQVCVESIPFYKRLLARMDGTKKRLVVLVQKGVVPVSEMLETHKFKPHKLTSGPAAVNDIPTAPWLFVIGPDGKRIGAWEGRLTAKQEAEILAAIGS